MLQLPLIQGAATRTLLKWVMTADCYRSATRQAMEVSMVRGRYPAYVPQSNSVIRGPRTNFSSRFQRLRSTMGRLQRRPHPSKRVPHPAAASAPSTSNRKPESKQHCSVSQHPVAVPRPPGAWIAISHCHARSPFPVPPTPTALTAPYILGSAVACTCPMMC